MNRKFSWIVLILVLAGILRAQEKPEFRPTFENCSFYWKPTGETGVPDSLTLRYRKLGDEDWITALEPVYIPDEKAWRGSILLLQENQTYETSIEVSGKILNDTFTTRNSMFPIGKTVELNTAGPITITESGTAEAYIRYTLPPGKELTGNARIGAVLTVTNAEFVILDGIVLKAGGAQSGILLENSRNIVLRNCEISDFGRTGKQRLDLDGKFFLEGSKQVINYDGGIEIRRSSDILVERCAVYAPRGHANSWIYSHPAGPCAVFMNFAQGGVVLRYNDFFGSDLRRYNDVIEGAGNGHENGGFFRDADIYGNLFALANDDGIELEGGGMNLRFYLNHVRNTLCGVSTGSCRLGPVYIFRNLFTCPGDQHGYASTSFKNGHGRQGKGTVFFFNNTVADPVRLGFNSFHSKAPELELGFFKGWGRNNIMWAERAFQRSFFRWPSSFNHDLLFSDDANEQVELKKSGQEENMVWGRARFVNAAADDYRLSNGSPGQGNAQAIPGMEISHVGAFQEDGIDALPYRPEGLWASRRKFLFTPDNFTYGQTLTVMAAADTSFRILQSDDFFSVEPSSGVLRKDVPFTFTVTYHPGRVGTARLSSGVAVLRQQDGWSLPLSIYADNRDMEDLQRNTWKDAIVFPVNGPETATEVDIPRDGRYWVFVEAGNRKPVDALLEIGDQKFERCRCVFSEFGREREICQLILRKRLDLKSGKVALRIKFNSGQVSRIILTDNPEYIFR